MDSICDSPKNLENIEGAKGAQDVEYADEKKLDTLAGGRR